MRAPTDQVRSATLDAVDVAKHRASELVSTGSDLVGSTIEKGASTLEGGIDRVSDRLPASITLPAVAVAKKHDDTHRVRNILLALAVLAGVLAVAKVLTGRSSDESPEMPGDTTGTEAKAG